MMRSFKSSHSTPFVTGATPIIITICCMQAEIEKLLKENKELKKQTKASAGSPAARSPEDLQKQAETLMKAIVKNIEGR